MKGKVTKGMGAVLLHRSIVAILACCLLIFGLTFVGTAAPVKQITVAYEAGGEQHIIHTKYAKEFEKKTGIKVNVLGIPAEEIHQKLLTELASGTCAYDVINIDSSLVASFATAGYLDNLDKWAKAADKKLFFPLALAGASWDGKLYQMPTSAEPVLLFYRQDLFAKNGIGQVPQTWDEYIADAKKLTVDLNGDKTIDIWGSVVEGDRKSVV